MQCVYVVCIKSEHSRLLCIDLFGEFPEGFEASQLPEVTLLGSGAEQRQPAEKYVVAEFQRSRVNLTQARPAECDVQLLCCQLCLGDRPEHVVAGLVAQDLFGVQKPPESKDQEAAEDDNRHKAETMRLEGAPGPHRISR